MTRADLLTLARAVRGDWEAARVHAALARVEPLVASDVTALLEVIEAV